MAYHALFSKNNIMLAKLVYEPREGKMWCEMKFYTRTDFEADGELKVLNHAQNHFYQWDIDNDDYVINVRLKNRKNQ